MAAADRPADCHRPADDTLRGVGDGGRECHRRVTRGQRAGMILADTSAWVEYDRATGSAVHTRIAGLIADEGPLAVTEPVIMEVLTGARNDQRQVDLRR